RYNRPLRATLAKAGGFFIFASAYWALLPLLARQQLGGGPQTYGMLLGAIGLGAVGGTLVLHRLKAWLGSDGLVIAGSLGTTLALALFAAARDSGVALLASVIAGLAWIAVLSTLNVSAQKALPSWVRGRGLATYATVMFGATTLGSLAWGQIASVLNLPVALVIAAAGLMVSIVLLRKLHVQTIAGLDLQPSMYWPELVVSDDPADDRGPVLVTIEYDIEAADRAAFVSAVYRQGAARKRNGAYRWGIFEDTAAPSRWVETFLIDSWLDYLRQRERLTKSDQQLETEVRRYQAHGEPKVRHFVGPEGDDNHPTATNDAATTT
ncbi:MAG: MFS transporter, partial [Solimonas sp.]